MKKARYIIGILLFLFAGMLFVYSFWAFVQCRSYIKDAIVAGQLSVKGNEYDIMNFYVSNCVQYIIDALILFAIGWLILRIPIARMGIPVVIDASNRKDEDEDLDQWFEEIQKGKA